MSFDPEAERTAMQTEMNRKRRFSDPIDRINQTLSAIVNPAAPTTVAPGALPALAGDVTGPPGSNTAVKLQGIPVSTTDPTTGQALKYDGAAWAPGTDSVGTPASTVVTETAFGQASAVGVGTPYARNDHTHGTPANPVTAHEAAGNPHGVYQLSAQKGAANGYPSLGADTLVPQDQLGTGTQDGTKFLRDDGTWQTIAAAGQYRVLTYVLDGVGGFEFVVDGLGNPVTALADLE